jgi:hypothetical protein
MVVVDVKGAPALRNRPACMLRDAHRSSKVVVVDLHVLIALEWQLVGRVPSPGVDR